jgi:hypothetical protein
MKGRIRKCVCGSRSWKASGAGNKRQGGNATHLRCAECGRERWSTHPLALKKGQEADKSGKAIIFDS